MARDQRRLAAIVSADVLGHSRLTGRDRSEMSMPFVCGGVRCHRSSRLLVFV